jgi:hypothetical protein
VLILLIGVGLFLYRRMVEDKASFTWRDADPPKIPVG